MKNKLKQAVALCVLLSASVVWAAQSGSMMKDDELKSEPFRDAKTLKALKAGETISMISKDGGWYKIKVGNSSGWVRMLSVRIGAAKQSASAATGLLALSSGRAATGKVVATTGIRGLNEEELKAASFNARELQLSESYAIKKDDAKKFAAQGKLVARPFDYLPDAQ